MFSPNRWRGIVDEIRYYIQLSSRLFRSGLSNFYQNRSDYARYRDVASLGAYLGLAKTRIIVVGVWMAQGTEMESVIGDLRQMLSDRRNAEVDIALVDPRSAMVPALAAYLGTSEAEVRTRIEQALLKLINLHSELPVQAQNRLDLRIYDIIPTFSGIVLDPGADDCRIQLDIKLFGQPRSNSFSFEFRGPVGSMVEILKTSIELWFDTARPIIGSELAATLAERN